MPITKYFTKINTSHKVWCNITLSDNHKGVKKMKKKVVIVSLSIILIWVLFFIVDKVSISGNSDILKDLEGEIYYTKRVDSVLTLFKANANLKNEQLIYSHKGKGETGFDDFNDHIRDYYVDRETGTIQFIAMNDGDWSLFSLTEGSSSPTFIRKEDFIQKTDYIKLSTDKLSVASKKGSIYLTENGQEKCIKKFRGIYDEKFTGFTPLGFSPDGNFLVYHSMEHLTPFGSIFEGIISNSDFYGHTYIMDLETGKSTRFIDAYNFQWIDK